MAKSYHKVRRGQSYKGAKLQGCKTRTEPIEVWASALSPRLWVAELQGGTYTFGYDE